MTEDSGRQFCVEVKHSRCGRTDFPDAVSTFDFSLLESSQIGTTVAHLFIVHDGEEPSVTMAVCVPAFAPKPRLLRFSDRLLKSHVNFSNVFYIRTITLDFSSTAAARLKGADNTPHAKKLVARRQGGQ